MIFCEKCFTDPELSLLVKNNFFNIGNCSLCSSKNVKLFNTETSDLTIFTQFEELVSIYSIKDELPDDYPIAECTNLMMDIKDRWGIFSKQLTRSNIREILIALCPDSYEKRKELFSDNVGIRNLYSEEYKNENSLLLNNTWDQFVTALIEKNRYHSNFLNLRVLKEYCDHIKKIYKKGTLFYRARISDELGFNKDEMSAPPSRKSSEGRANARGITCLYLADSRDTCLYEIRSGVNDYVTIGEFELLQDITVVDLSLIDKVSPFRTGIDFVAHYINKPFFEKINKEISKVLRRSDSTLDYIPTQYIADFIKSIEVNQSPLYSGIQYNSTVYNKGYNLAIFNPILFHCNRTELFEIEEINLKYKTI